MNRTIRNRLPNNDNDDNHREHNENDQQYKAQDFLLEGSQSFLGLACQFSNPAKDSRVSSRDNDTDCTPSDAMRSLKSNAVGFKVVVIRGIDSPVDWQRLA